jgi:hypothetical protein
MPARLGRASGSAPREQRATRKARRTRRRTGGAGIGSPLLIMPGDGSGALSPGRALPRRSGLVTVVRQDLHVDRGQEAVDAPFEGPLCRGGAVEVSGGDGAVAEQHPVRLGPSGLALARRQNEGGERQCRDRAECGGGAGRCALSAGPGPTAAERPDRRPPPAARDRRRRLAPAGLGQRPLPLPLHAALLPARPLPAGHPRSPGLAR